MQIFSTKRLQILSNKMVEGFNPSDFVLTYLESNHLPNPVMVEMPDSLSKRIDARIAGVCLTNSVVK
jgi:hypothetical protein